MGVTDALSLTELPLEISYLPQTAQQAKLAPDRALPQREGVTVIHRAAKRKGPAGGYPLLPIAASGPGGSSSK